MTGKMSAHVRTLVFKFLFDLWFLESVNIKSLVICLTVDKIQCHMCSATLVSKYNTIFEIANIN